MRSLSTVLFVLLFNTLSFAQFSLNASDFWTIGDNVTLLESEVGALQPGPAGANQTWDFSTIAPNGTVRELNYEDPATTARGASFPGATLAERSTDDGGVVGYTYYKITSQAMTLLGVDTDPATVFYHDEQELFNFPFSFNSMTSGTNAANYTTTGVAVARMGTSSTVMDGYGTLKLPSGTYNAVRVKAEQRITDTISAFGITTQTNTTSYIWFVEGVLHAVLNYSIVENITAGMTFTGTTIFYQGEIGDGGGQMASKRFIPHVTRPNGDFTTNFFMKNQSAQVTNMTIEPYSTAGASLTPVALSFAPNELKIINQDDLFGGADVSHFYVEDGEAVVITAGYKVAQGEGATCHFHESETTATNFRVYPGEWDIIFDGIALVNTGDAAASLTAIARSSTGSSTQVMLNPSLAPASKYLGVFDTFFQQDDESIIEITSTQPISALFLRGSRGAAQPAYLYANLPQTTPGGTRWLPHVTRPNRDFDTIFYLNNHAGSSQTITLQPYLNTGQALATQAINLGPNELRVVTHSEIFGAVEVSHFSISGSTMVSVSAGYKVAQGPGATAHFHETSEMKTEFWVYPGEPDLVFDGMAIVNLGNGPATVTGTLQDQAGGTVAIQNLATGLAAKAKQLGVFNSLFPAISASNILHITSDQPIAVLFLRGTLAGTEPAYLYANQPLP